MRRNPLNELIGWRGEKRPGLGRMDNPNWREDEKRQDKIDRDPREDPRYTEVERDR